jgi:hypothetical protein
MTVSYMVTHFLISARVAEETKRRVHEAARAQLLTESIWLRKVVEAALQASGSTSSASPLGSSPRDHGASKRVYVRLRAEDRLLLCERAAARGMPAATYLSVLARSHLRDLAPLPREELQALKRSVAELGAIGRNLNQLARAANEGGRTAAANLGDLRVFLKVCEGLRDHVKGLIKVNLGSWRSGHARTEK